MGTSSRGRTNRDPSGARQAASASQRDATAPGPPTNAGYAASPADGPPPSSLPAIPPASAAITTAQGGALGRFLRGFVYAGRGLLYALRTQRNARVHAALAAAAIALGIALRLSPVEFAVVFIVITSVFVAEMFNTVVEACVDLVTQEYHPMARIAKDVAAGAVLLNAILAVVVALFVYVPHLWPLLLRWLGK